MVLLFAAALAGVTVSAESKTLTASGVSEISFDDAIRDAQRNAVSEGVGVFIDSRTEIENFVLKNDRVFSETNGYITAYKVLTKKETDDGYSATIEATVSLDMVKNDLVAMKILLESLERPKLMILIGESYKGMESFDMNIARVELSSQLVAKGFELVDHAQLQRVKEMSELQYTQAENKAAAASLALRFGAQYVIVGKSVVQDSGEAFPGSGIRSIQSSVQLEVIQAQTALVLGSTVQSSVATHTSPLSGSTKALKNAVTKAVDGYLIKTITDSFQNYLNNGSPLKLEITNVSTFREYRSLMKRIAEVEQISSCKKDGWNKGAGLLLLSLRFKGSSETLAELLDGIVSGEKELFVTDFAPEKVMCEFK